MQKFKNLIAAAVKSHFSDLHITGGHPLVYRQNGNIKFDSRFSWTPQEVDELVRQLLSPAQLKMLNSRHSADLALSLEQARARINVFNTSRGLSLAIRILPGRVPSLDELNLHPSLKDLCAAKSGLILICGSAGSGKSTTIAGLINQLNRTMSVHAVTLEDPIEYRFKPEKTFIEQRELGAHFPTYERGLLDVLREAADVIVVGELREPEAMRLTLDAAESGHLVIASMHAANVWECLYRMCNSFPLTVQDLVRHQLASTLNVVVAQQLPYFQEYGFRIPVLSMLLSNSSVRGIIRDNKLSQLDNILHMNRSQGMFTFEQYRSEYIDAGTGFSPPLWLTSPDSGTSWEWKYESPLVDPAALEKHQRQSHRVIPEAGSSFPDGSESDSSFVSIEDSRPLDEVIKGLADH